MIPGTFLNGNKQWAMRTFVSLMCLVAAGSPAAAAPADSASTTISSKRYLLIFETSRAMQRRSDNAVKLAADLVESGLNGQMQTGDTLGIWTYNETLSAGKFPLARWSADTSEQIAKSARQFLSREKFEKQADFHPVMVALNTIARNSPYLTIIVISTGEDEMSGITFASRINESYNVWKAEQQKAKMPFVTVLRARRGQFAGYSVTPAPWQIEIPPWPVEPQISASKINPLVATNPAPSNASTNVGALIFTGKKPKPSVADETNTSAANSTAPTAAVSTANETLDPRPSNVARPQTPSPTSSALVPEPKPPVEKPVEKAAAATAQTSSKSPTSIAPIASQALNPTQETKTQAIVPSGRTQDSTPAPVQNAAAVARQSPLNVKVVWICGLAALVVLGAFFFLRLRHNQNQESLITRSLDREQK